MGVAASIRRPCDTEPLPLATNVRQVREALRLAVLALALTGTGSACVSVQSGFTLGPENDGTTKRVTVGSELRLALSADYDWNIASTNTSALALKSSAVGSAGGSNVRMWLFDVRSAGQFVLRATGEPPCRKSSPPCATPTLTYRFTIHAQ